MKEDVKRCYELLAAIFLNHTKEDRAIFANLLTFYTSNLLILSFVPAPLEKKLKEIDSSLDFPIEVKIEAVKKLVQIFNVKPQILKIGTNDR